MNTPRATPIGARVCDPQCQILQNAAAHRDTRFTGAFRVTGQGVYFVAGERRVVYASAQGNGRWSTSCARTALVFRPADQEAADLAMCEGAETSPRHAGVKEGAAAPRRR